MMPVRSCPPTLRAARLTLLLVATALLGFAVVACGGGDEGAREETTRAGTTQEAAAPPPPGTPAQAVEDFLSAVEAGDRNLSWALLSKETKTAFQLDFQHWSDTLLPELRRELEPGGTPIFSERFGDERAFVVLEGVAEGALFPAAVRAEDGGWRMELFYPEFTPIRPEPGERVKPGKLQVQLDIVRRRDQDLNVRMWLDGEPIVPTILNRGSFNNSYEAEVTVTPGKHVLIAYATTGEGLSGGAAWEFTAR